MPLFNPPTLPTLVNSLIADVILNNSSNFFDGPSVAQGTNGKWYASGTVTLADTGVSGGFDVKLWDGTTVISSAQIITGGANVTETVSLSGVITSPAANIKMSVKEVNATTGKILFNASGSSKDSTLQVMRVG